MTGNKLNDYCSSCRNRGTDACKVCSYCEKPSGKITEPSLWKFGTVYVATKGGVPPVGVKPRFIHDDERAHELAEAIVRYLNAALPIPSEWVSEYNELRARAQERKPK